MKLCERRCPECGEQIGIKKILRTAYRYGENDFKCINCGNIIHIDWGKGIVYLMLPVLLISIVSTGTIELVFDVLIRIIIILFIGVPLSILIAVCKVPVIIK